MPDLPPPRPLRALRPGLWIKESFLHFAGIKLMTRMVVIRLQGGLLLYSPSPATLDDATAAELTGLGEVRWLVAPNEIHNVGLRAFQAAWPEAHTTGCLGHPKRVPGVRFDVLVDASTPAEAVPWAASGELRWHVIGGNLLLHEIALLHVATRSLVLTDAVEIIGAEHLAGEVPGPLTRGMLRLAGLRLGEPCMSPEHGLLCDDPEALAASAAVLEGWAPELLVLAHGELREGEAARAALHAALRDTVAAARGRGGLRRGLGRWAARLA